MADIQVTLAKYKPVVGNVSNGAKIASVTTPEHIAKTSQPSVRTSFADTSLNVIVENAGETSIPEAGIGSYASDDLSVADTYSKQIGKKFEELKTTSDVFSKVVLFQRVFIELQTTNEQLVFDNSKTLIESFARVDQLSLSFEKQIEESFIRLDTIALHLSSVYSESNQTSDLVVFNSNKGVVETQITTDILTRVFTVFRSFVDIVDATDDVMGEANIDDDQVAAVNKAAIDWLAQSDLYSSSVVKVFNDLGNFSELSYFNVFKAHLDIPLTVDLIYFELLTLLNDVANSSDVASSSFEKISFDTASNYDIYNFNSIKVVYDSNLLSDLNSKVFGKSLTEFANESDTVYQNFDKYLEHSFAKSDATYWLIDKGLVETQLTSEVLSFVLSYNLLDTALTPDQLSVNFEKPFDDLFNESDLATYLVGKQALDVNYTSELFYFDKTKAIVDLVDATDDVFGEANVDDDQIAAFTKTLADQSTTSEDFSRTFTAYRDYSDIVNESDIVYLQPGISKLETAQTSELKLFGVSTVYNDAESVSDVNNKDIYSVSLDSYSISDVITIVGTYFKDFNELKSISETLSQDYLKQLIESTVTSELLAKNISKGFTDIVTTSESVTPVNGRAFNEPQDISDSGTANNQNYFSSDYVEPGYVGTNTYF